jgi:hypothetical protein
LNPAKSDGCVLLYRHYPIYQLGLDELHDDVDDGLARRLHS